MKKANKLLAILVVILAFGLLLPACNCDVKDSHATGAIGKVQKYRKEQMSEKDLKLRSEIIEDTAALRNTLQGMLLYYVYKDAYAKSLRKNAELLKELPANEDNQLGAEELDNYCTFIENGNEQLCEVCQMCSDLYNDTVTENSFDIEQGLRNYTVYLDKLHSRDSLVGSMIDKSDFWIKNNENKTDKEDQVKKVKSIRDEILLREITGAIVTNNQDKINTYSDKIIYNVSEVFKNVFNVESSEELQNGCAGCGFINSPNAVAENVSASAPNVSSHIIEAYNVGVFEFNNFNQTGNVQSFVDAINSFTVANSQVTYDAAGNVVQSQDNFNAGVNTQNDKANPMAIPIIYSYVVEGFDNIKSMDNNMQDIVHQMSPGVENVAQNVNSSINEYSSSIITNFSNYITQSDAINYYNIDNLSAVINPK